MSCSWWRYCSGERRGVARAGVLGMLGCRGCVSFDDDGWWRIIASLMLISLDEMV
jgi:hypothetical protein